MTKESRLLANRLVQSLRSGHIDATLIQHLQNIVQAAFHDDQFPPRLLGKLLHRHARKPGRKRTSAASKERVAAAAIWARYNRTIGEEQAATEAADIYGVKASAVYRAAFERKDQAMNELIRATNPEKIIRDTEKILRGDMATNVVSLARPHFRKDNAQ